MISDLSSPLVLKALDELLAEGHTKYTKDELLKVIEAFSKNLTVINEDGEEIWNNEYITKLYSNSYPTNYSPGDKRDTLSFCKRKGITLTETVAKGDGDIFYNWRVLEFIFLCLTAEKASSDALGIRPANEYSKYSSKKNKDWDDFFYKLTGEI